MMQFTKIDINNWTRKEYFDHYFDNTPCTYSMTVKLDISKLKKDGKKLYEYARAGIEVKREPRPVEIYAIQDITKEADDLSLIHI